MLDESMTTSSTQPVMPVPLAELTTREWVHLTWGLFWRSVVWALVASVLGSLLSVAVAFGVNAVVDGALHPSAYMWTSGIATVLVSLAVMLLLFGWYTRWTLGARYGGLRVVVVREQSPR